MDGLDGLFRDPNGGAYERQEVRIGPPLGYVAEKSRMALEELHDLYRAVQDAPFQDTPEMPFSELLGRIRATTYYTLVAHLALTNMLGQVQNAGAAERFLAYSPDDFKRWLDLIDREGTVAE